MESKKSYRTLDEVTEEYLRNHPDEIDQLIKEVEQEGDQTILEDLMQIVRRIRDEIQ